MASSEQQFFEIVAQRQVVRPSVRAVIFSTDGKRLLVQRPSDSPGTNYAFDPPFSDVVADCRVGQLDRAVLVGQPSEHPQDGVTLLAGAVRSSTSIASIAALNGSKRGADRTRRLRGGGSAANSA